MTKIDKLLAKYLKKDIVITNNNGDEQKVNMSIFQEGIAFAPDVAKVVSLFDSNKDGRISNEEAAHIQKMIVESAGKDKKLDDDEILKMLGYEQEQNDSIKTNILTQFKNMVERQFSGALKTTIKKEDGTIITSDFNRDGSGTTTTTNRNGQTVISTYSAGNILVKKEIKNQNGSSTVVEYENNEQGKPVKSKTVITDAKGKTTTSETVYEYDNEGRLSKTTTSEDAGKTAELPNGNTVHVLKTVTTEYTYDEHGNKKQTVYHNDTEGLTVITDYDERGNILKQDTRTKKIKLTKDSNGKQKLEYETASKVLEYTYDENGKRIACDINATDIYGNPTKIHYDYDEKGEVAYCTKSYIKRGAKVEEKYDGQNLKNRIAGSVPTERIEYNDMEGAQVKQRTVFKYDEEGILIGDEIFDADGKKIGEHDYTSIDEFGTAYQKGRGDCYLLAAINSLVNLDEGLQLLNEIVKNDGDNFVISFPGAKVARENLIKELQKTDPNYDISKINIPDEYTITPEELKEAMKLSGAKYSIGNKKVLLLEIAYEKYRKCVADTLKDNKLKPSDYMTGFTFNKEYIDKDDYLSNGTCQEAIFILTARKSQVYVQKDIKNVPVCYIDSDYQMHVADNNGYVFENTKAGVLTTEDYSKEETARDEIISKLIQDSKDGKLDQYAANAGFKVSTQEVNGQVINNDGHGLMIKNVTEDSVTLGNPWYPETDVVMSMEDFKRAATSIQILELKTDSAPQSNGNPAGASNVPTTGNLPAANGNQTVNNGGAQNNNGVTNNSQVQAQKPNYTVKPGEGFTAIIKRELQKQGIKPSPNNIIKAKEQFKSANPGAVLVYNGKRKEWKGNEYLLMHAKVYIPQFNKDENGNVI